MTLSNVPFEQTIAGRIRAARKAAGLSQEAFAKAVGTSRRHVMRWENGTYTPSDRFAERIAEVTGSSAELFQEESIIGTSSQSRGADGSLSEAQPVENVKPEEDEAAA